MTRAVSLRQAISAATRSRLSRLDRSGSWSLPRRAISLAGTALLTLLLCTVACTASPLAKIKINVRQSDAAIKQQLSQLTPLGTPAKEVYEFLQNRLELNPGSSAPGTPRDPSLPANTIVELGHYYELRNLFIFPTVVQAFYDFDEHNRLISIGVRRFIADI